MCGIAAGDPDDRTGRPARLHVGHILDKRLGGSDEPGNLRALCSRCNQGAKNITQEPPSYVWLMAQLRRARENDQRAAFEWLQQKFGDDT
ncbi:MAG: HNH endonuclease [Gammaproteobacteria bacterium]|nr:HNH endonuclease [Gammaproteobacteria bacterium]